MQNFENEYEKAVRFICNYFPRAEEMTKPTLFHSLRVGNYLFENGYDREITLAGLLHDTLEDTSVTGEILNQEFGLEVENIVRANTKNPEIEDKSERREILVINCVQSSEKAAIIKSADIIDNIKYYERIENKTNLDICQTLGRLLIKNLPSSYQDKIFGVLKSYL